MTARALCASLRAENRPVRVAGDTLFIGDGALLTDEQRSAIKEHKQDLLEIYGCPPDPTLPDEVWIPCLLKTDEEIENFIDRQRIKSKQQRGA